VTGADEKNRTLTERIGRLRGVSWDWRDEAPDEVKRQPGMGVIAQDVERVFPELVTTGADGYKRVNYIGLIGPLIEAVKELAARVEALERRVGRDDSNT
jgi:Chaperone of endosialidase